MKILLVWYLVTVTQLHSGMVAYSPPMPTLQDCEFLKKSLPEYYMQQRSRCIQLNVVEVAK